MKSVLLATALGLFVFSGMALANQIDIIDLDEALCQKLASSYAKDLNSLTKDEIEQLRFCLAFTWGQRPDTVPPVAPGGLSIIKSQSSSKGTPDNTSPKAPTGVIIK